MFISASLLTGHRDPYHTSNSTILPSSWQHANAENGTTARTILASTPAVDARGADRGCAGIAPYLTKDIFIAVTAAPKPWT
jgi:hypothetical protein